MSVNNFFVRKSIQRHSLTHEFLTAGNWKHKQNMILTAATDGTLDPGEPWETSIPKMMVGTLDT